MLSVVIAAREGERALVQTLAALVGGAAAGLVKQAVIADATGSAETARIADIAGCDLVTGTARGPLLAEAARRTRGTWLLFLAQGLVPDPAWIGAVQQFIEDVENSEKDAALAASFRLSRRTRYGREGLDFGSMAEALRLAFGGLPRPEQGLLIARRFYDRLGGHRDGPAPERDLLRRIGRRRLALLEGSALRHQSGAA